MISSQNRKATFPDHAKGKADDARQPLVEIVLVLGLLGLHRPRRSIAGHELGAPAPSEIAGEFRIPVILKLPSLVELEP